MWRSCDPLGRTTRHPDASTHRRPLPPGGRARTEPDVRGPPGRGHPAGATCSGQAAPRLRGSPLGRPVPAGGPDPRPPPPPERDQRVRHRGRRRGSIHRDGARRGTDAPGAARHGGPARARTSRRDREPPGLRPRVRPRKGRHPPGRQTVERAAPARWRGEACGHGDRPTPVSRGPHRDPERAGHRSVHLAGAGAR